MQPSAKFLATFGLTTETFEVFKAACANAIPHVLEDLPDDYFPLKRSCAVELVIDADRLMTHGYSSRDKAFTGIPRAEWETYYTTNFKSLLSQYGSPRFNTLMLSAFPQKHY